jgi:hypothetical protein
VLGDFISALVDAAAITYNKMKDELKLKRKIKIIIKTISIVGIIIIIT